MKMIKMLATMWAYSPKETEALMVITVACGAMMAALIGLLLWPTEPDRMEET